MPHWLFRAGYKKIHSTQSSTQYRVHGRGRLRNRCSKRVNLTREKKRKWRIEIPKGWERQLRKDQQKKKRFNIAFPRQKQQKMNKTRLDKFNKIRIKNKKHTHNCRARLSRDAFHLWAHKRSVDVVEATLCAHSRRRVPNWQQK